MLSVRGAPDAALAGSFFLHGGRIEGIEFCGAGTFGQDGIETLGWWHGTIANCRFHRLGGNGLRAIGDPEHGQNPDFTASILTCEGCDFERLGGWGFLDDNPIGAPGWRFDHCIFNLCAGGGAFVRSSGHEYLGCTFAGCGFVDERTPAQTFGTGLRIGDAAGPAISRTRVVVAEFDANKDAHVVVDRVASLLVEDVRFIHHDRFGSGHPSPPLAVQLGTDALRSEVVQTRFLRPPFRLDTPGPVTGFRIASLARTHDLVIERGVWAQEFSGETGLVKFDGFPDPIAAKGQRIDAQEGR